MSRVFVAQETALDRKVVIKVPSMWRGSVHHSVRELGVFVPYRMPIAGLYQTGGSTAPGGSVTGQPGRNAAIAMLQDDGKSLEQVLGKLPRP
jgi:phytoene dehydrogenase-like protein